VHGALTIVSPRVSPGVTHSGPSPGSSERRPRHRSAPRLRWCARRADDGLEPGHARRHPTTAGRLALAKRYEQRAAAGVTPQAKCRVAWAIAGA
jgi:hypothetical protein